MNLLTAISASKLVNGIKAKKFSCVEVITEYLAQIKLVNPKINALVQQIDEGLALELAKKSDEAIAKNQKVGKLHGLPMTIKDHFQVKDFISTRIGYSPV